MPNIASKKSWHTRRFDEMAVMVNDRIDDPSVANVDRYVGLEHLDSDSLAIRRWGVPADVEATKLRFRAGDIIFGRRRAYQRKLGVADFDGICSAHAMVLRAKPDVALPEFLPFFMQSDVFMERAKEISVGSLSPTINWRTLAQQEFGLPPLAAQRRMAEAFGAVDTFLSALDQVARSTNEVASGTLERALGPKNTWPLEAVEALLLESPRNGVSPAANADGRGLRTVSISSVRNGVFDPTGCIKHADIDVARAEPYLIKRGDAFVIRGNGNRRLVGQVGLSEASFEDVFYPDLLIRLRFDSAKILPRFAVAQWNLPSVHRRLTTRAKSSNGIWKVNGQDIRAHRLRRPPLAEQEKILRDLVALQEAIKTAQERHRALKQIKTLLLESVAGDTHE